MTTALSLHITVPIRTHVNKTFFVVVHFLLELYVTTLFTFFVQELYVSVLLTELIRWRSKELASEEAAKMRPAWRGSGLQSPKSTVFFL